MWYEGRYDCRDPRYDCCERRRSRSQDLEIREAGQAKPMGRLVPYGRLAGGREAVRVADDSRQSSYADQNGRSIKCGMKDTSS